MKSVFMMTALALAACAVATPALAKTSCEEVKTQIEAKIQAKGVMAFTLTIVPKDEKTELRVVGTCDGGTKKIIYKRG
ncbi:MAG: DUF1161 domain-containing protein [Betaproteobacteria bacterium]